jgi:hypothetical protein
MAPGSLVDSGILVLFESLGRLVDGQYANPLY